MCIRVDLFILTIQVIRLIEDFRSAIQKGPTYIYDICWEFEFRGGVIKLKELKY